MEKDIKRYFKLEFSIETPDATEDEVGEFLSDVVGVVERYGYTTGGGIREVNEDGSEITGEHIES